MASEYGLELLDKVQRDFAKYYANDSKIKKLTKKIANNSQNYEDANEYAIRVGELASKALTNHVNSNDLNYISRELAEDVLKPTLTTDYELISNAVWVIQGNKNKASKIGLQPQIADLDTNRIDGLINKIASYETLDQGEYLLKEPVVNYSQAVVDDSIRKNAKVQAKAGLTPKIRRVADSGACRWCRALEGVYEPQDAPDNIYRRHEFCRCTVTYENGKERQDVWSKTKWEVKEEKARVEEIKKLEENNNINVLGEKGTNIIREIYENTRVVEGLRETPINDMSVTIFKADYSKASPKLAQGFNRVIDKYKNRYTSFLVKINPMDKMETISSKDVFARTRTRVGLAQSEIVYNPLVMKNDQVYLQRITDAINNGHAAKVKEGMEFDYIATHEYAHSILNHSPMDKKKNWVEVDFKKRKNALDELDKLFSEYEESVRLAAENKNKAFENTLLDSSQEAWGLFAESERKYKETIISRYSLTNADEFLAESFVEQEIGLHQNEYAKRALEILDKYYGG